MECFVRLALTVILAATTIGIAHAGPRAPIKAAITYTKTQLQTEQGAEAVLAQIERQVRDACTTNDAGWRMVIRKVDKTCADELMIDTLNKIDEPALTQAYEKQQS